MVSLIQTFQTKPDDYGFVNDLDISCDYDPEQDSIDNVKVRVYSRRKMVITDITEIFSVTPFAEVVDNIEWAHLYRDHLEQSNKAA